MSDINWVTGLTNPFGIAVSGAYMYISNVNSGSVSQLNAITGAIINASWATGLSAPRGIIIDGSYLYVLNAGTNNIIQINLANGTIANASW